jgi:hypothetical protein
VLAEIIGPDILIVAFFLLIPALAVAVAIDAATKPDWAFQRAGQNKVLWIVAPLVGIFLCGIVAVGVAIGWFASVRPKVMAATRGLPS